MATPRVDYPHKIRKGSTMIRLTFYRADGTKETYHYDDDDDYAVTTHLIQESQDDSVTIEIKIVEPYDS